MLQRISRLLSTVGQPGSPLKPTELFNEGWMLRLVLDQVRSEPPQQHPFLFASEAKWYSEGLLPSPFLAEHRGDVRAEGWTNADGVIGHFAISQFAKGDLSLVSPKKQLIVVEAKMFSGLSPGVKRCAAYDQASRYVACIAQVITIAKIEASDIDGLAFYVVAPRSQIDAGIFGQRMQKESIERSVRSRVDMYAGARDQWFNERFLPTLAAIQIQLISWESILAGLPQELHDFYARCVEFNRPGR